MCVLYIPSPTTFKLQGERVRCSGSIEAQRKKGGDAQSNLNTEKSRASSPTRPYQRDKQHASYLNSPMRMILDGNGGEGQLEMGSSAGAPLGQGKNCIKNRNNYRNKYSMHACIQQISCMQDTKI